MPLYVMVRAGQSPATSGPVLVVADQRLIKALVDELARMAGATAEYDNSPPSAPLTLLRFVPIPHGEEG